MVRSTLVMRNLKQYNFLLLDGLWLCALPVPLVIKLCDANWSLSLVSLSVPLIVPFFFG